MSSADPDTYLLHGWPKSGCPVRNPTPPPYTRIDEGGASYAVFRHGDGVIAREDLDAFAPAGDHVGVSVRREGERITVRHSNDNKHLFHMFNTLTPPPGPPFGNRFGYRVHDGAATLEYFIVTQP